MRSCCVRSRTCGYQSLRIHTTAQLLIRSPAQRDQTRQHAAQRCHATPAVERLDAPNVWASLVQPGDENIRPAQDVGESDDSPGPASTSGRTCSTSESTIPFAVWQVQLASAQRGHHKLAKRRKASLKERRWLRRHEDRPKADELDEVELHQRAMQAARKGKKEQALGMLAEGRRRHPSNVFFPHSAAVICAKLGRHEEARQLFKDALAINPNNGATLQALALLEKKLGHAHDARELFKLASEVDPKNAPTWCAWALFEAGQGDKSRARQLFQTALQFNASHEPTLNAFAKLEMSVGNWESAKTLLQSVLRSNPTHAHSWTVLGELCFRQGDFEQGRQMFLSAKRYCGEDSIVCAGWADMELKLGDTAKAMTLLKRSLQLDRHNYQAWVLLAGSQARTGNFAAALRTYEEAIELAPNNLYLQHSYSQFLVSIGKSEQAQALLQDLVDKHPDNGKLWHTLGTLQLRGGAIVSAASCFKRGLQDTNNSAALINYEELAMLAALEGRQEVARDLFQRGSLSHSPTSRYLRMWALFEKRMGEPERAQMLFRQSVECDAMDVKSWMHWGLLERRLGHLEHAMHLFNQALEIAPKNYHTWYLYCETATQVKPLSECRDIFKGAHQQATKSPQLYMMEAMMEWRAGSSSRAESCFKTGAECARGDPVYYCPIFEAWSQFEDSQGRFERAAQILAEFHAISAAEQRHTSNRKIREVQPMFAEASDNKHLAAVDTAMS